VDISWLSENLLYKDIPLTLYVKIDNVMDKEIVFITQNHNSTNVKYLPCALEGIMSWMLPIYLRICCMRTFRQSFRFTTHMTILTQHGIC
jgi:hypothetical protein